MHRRIIGFVHDRHLQYGEESTTLSVRRNFIKDVEVRIW